MKKLTEAEFTEYDKLMVIKLNPTPTKDESRYLSMHAISGTKCAVITIEFYLAKLSGAENDIEMLKAHISVLAQLAKLAGGVELMEHAQIRAMEDQFRDAG